MRERLPAVYIVASKRNGTIYTGVTSDLPGQTNPDWYDLYESLF